MTIARVLLLLILIALPLAAVSNQEPKRKSTGNRDCQANPSRWDLAGERQKLVMSEQRRFGLAIECYAMDEHIYAGPSKGIEPLASLKSLLSPIYIETILTTDVWGSEYRYWSDGGHYAIISYGSDRSPDVDYDTLLLLPWDQAQSAICTGRSSDPAVDIVFADGNHCRWYEPEED